MLLQHPARRRRRTPLPLRRHRRRPHAGRARRLARPALGARHRAWRPTSTAGRTLLPRQGAVHRLVVRNGDPAEAHPSKPWKACQDFREFALQSVADLDADLVVVSTSMPDQGRVHRPRLRQQPEGHGRALQAGLPHALPQLRQATDGRVVLLRDVPARKPKSDPLTASASRATPLRDCLSPQDIQTGRVKLIDASVPAARRPEHVQVADPTSWLLLDGDCPASVGKACSPTATPRTSPCRSPKRMSGALADVLGLR